jgi:hypothetical protein
VMIGGWRAWGLDQESRPGSMSWARFVSSSPQRCRSRHLL